MRSHSNVGIRDSAGNLDVVLEVLRSGREAILADWIERTRDNDAVRTDITLSDPLLLDHLPQLYDAILDRIENNHPRKEAEQFAAVHGFTRRISGYDSLETTIELMMFRHAIWRHLLAADPPQSQTLVAMEAIDGMVDRAVIASLRAFENPAAGMLVRKGALNEGSDGAPPSESIT